MDGSSGRDDGWRGTAVSDPLMNPNRPTKRSFHHAGRSPLRRVGLYALLVANKAFVCLLLLDVCLEGGFAKLAEGVSVQESVHSLASATGCHDRGHDAAHTPTSLSDRPPRLPVAVYRPPRAAVLVLGPLARPNGQRDPPLC